MSNRDAPQQRPKVVEARTVVFRGLVGERSPEYGGFIDLLRVEMARARPAQADVEDLLLGVVGVRG
jgi:hypothetical protein